MIDVLEEVGELHFVVAVPNWWECPYLAEGLHVPVSNLAGDRRLRR